MLRLRFEREKRGLSQLELSILSGIHTATISKLELGKLYPYPKWRKRLAEALGWPIDRADELFEEVDEDE